MNKIIGINLTSGFHVNTEGISIIFPKNRLNEI
jgi:hypothetical protein